MKRYWPVFLIAGLLLVITPVGRFADKLISTVFLEFVVLGKIPLVGWQLSFGPVFIALVAIGLFYTTKKISRFTDTKIVPHIERKLAKQLSSKQV